MLQWFKEKILSFLQPIESQDDFFGRLVYMQMPKGRHSYWEAVKSFKAAPHEVELFIDAPAPMQIPNEAQRRFFSDVESNFARLLDAAEPLMRQEYEKMSGENLAAALDNKFRLVCFTIPNASLAEALWEMSFESNTNDGHLFTVTMQGDKAQAVTVDG